MGFIVDYKQALRDLLNVSSVPATEVLTRMRSRQPLYLPEEKQTAVLRAEDFIVKYGHLRSVPSQFSLLPAPTRKNPATRVHPSEIVFAWSAAFDAAVSPWSNAREQNEQLNKMFLEIFNDPVGSPAEERMTALRVDILAGTVEPQARDLLDAMAIELLRSRKSIARCALCSRFFYRQYSHDKYCSPACGDEFRRKSQLEWVNKKRAKKKEEAKQSQTKKGRKTH